VDSLPDLSVAGKNISQTSTLLHKWVKNLPHRFDKQSGKLTKNRVKKSGGVDRKGGNREHLTGDSKKKINIIDKNNLRNIPVLSNYFGQISCEMLFF
jgi:hypothetical protein